MWFFSRSSARANRASLTGSAIIVALASALLTATGVLLESGLRTGLASDTVGGSAMLLAMVASSFAGTTILIVVFMLSSTIAGALRQRRRELALLRAIGATGRQVRSLVTREVLLVLAVAAPLGAVPGLVGSRLLTPTLESSGIVPAGYELTLTPIPVVATLLLLVPTCLLAARLASREAVRTSPTAAVQQSQAEPARLGKARIATAVYLTAGGIVLALTPFFLPGIGGTMAGVMSAFLLITAGALAGPAIVAWLAERGLRATAPLGWASGHLALANARGFSRRLTTAVVPLALLIALGTVQSAFDRTTVAAAGEQLTAGLHADLVVDASTGTTAAQVVAVPGVAATFATAAIRADVKIEDDDEEMPLFDSLSWEAGSLAVLPRGAGSDILDLDVREGSVAALDGVDTVAVGRDALFGTGKGYGDSIEVRWPDGAERTATIVAVYGRSLGFGDLVVGEATLAAHGLAAQPDSILVQTVPGGADGVAQQLATLGAPVRDVAAHVEAVKGSGGSMQDLSMIFLLALLGFVTLAGANTLAMLSGQRGGELALLRRTGATGRQLTAMVLVEAVFVIGAAVLLGTVAVLPALVGAGYGMLGAPLPVVDWAMFGGLAAVVAVVALVTTVPITLRRRAVS